jgi:hypothetical protein
MEEEAPQPQQPKSKPKHASALKKSSFAPHVIASGKPLSKMQQILALSTTAYTGLKLNESGETFLATINIDPPKELHPVEELIYTLKVILLSGLTIDSEFALHPVYDELSSELPPLVSTEKDFPTAAREVVHYAYCLRPWQLVKVKEGQKDNRGRPKKQSNIYVVIRIKSAFENEEIMRWLLPELDMLGSQMTLKGVQLVETWGLHPDFCPGGFKLIVIRVFNLEADAMVARGELSKTDRGTLNFTDLFFKSSGIKSFHLANPADKAKHGTDQFLDTLG